MLLNCGRSTPLMPWLRLKKTSLANQRGLFYLLIDLGFVNAVLQFHRGLCLPVAGWTEVYL